MTHFTILDYSVFIVYLVASVLVGVLFIKEQRGLKSYFLAGQNMGFIVVGISILAALFSGVSYLSIPSEVYEHGMGFFLTVISFFIATPIATVIFLPFFYRSRFYTAYQYLEERFSVQVRVLASSLFILRVVVWLSLATYAPALALKEVTGMPLWFTIVCTGVLTTVYTTLGGMKAVIWTDVMQFFVLIGGQLVILAIAVSHIPGGLEGVYEMGRDHGKLDIDFSFSPTVRVTFWGALIGGAFMNLVQMATDQVSVQRYLTASSLKEAQRSLWLKLAFLLPVLIIFYLTGLVLYVFYQIHGDPVAAGTISKPDQLLPYFVITELPRGMPGLLVAAIFAASMSTISAGINSLTSATLVDFYGRLWKRDKVVTDEHQLKLARYLTLFYGALVMALAFVVHKLGSLLSVSNSIIGLVGGPLLGLFLLGMLSKRANAIGAVVGWFFGVCTMIWVFADGKISLLWYALIGLTVTLSVGWCVSWLFAAPRPQQLKGFSWDSRYEDEKQPAQNSPSETLTSAHDDKK